MKSVRIRVCGLLVRALSKVSSIGIAGGLRARGIWKGLDNTLDPVRIAQSRSFHAGYLYLPSGVGLQQEGFKKRKQAVKFSSARLVC